jgi:hypothetical protein
LSTGANRSENVAALASRAAASDDEIRVWNPTEATAIKIAPKIKLRISPSFMGVTHADARTALFQDGFAVSGKEFRSRQSVERWAGAASVPHCHIQGCASCRAALFFIPIEQLPGLSVDEEPGGRPDK